MIRELWRATRAEIDLRRLAANLDAIRRAAGPARRVMAVVKADAYGHGARQIARALAAKGVDAFGVALIEEGRELREAGVKGEIFALGGFPPAAAAAVVGHRLTPAVFDLDAARALDRAARNAHVCQPVHFKVDTGMGRLGVRVDDFADFARVVSGLQHLEPRGLFTTLLAADDRTRRLAQVRELERARLMLQDLGVGPIVVHAANSTALESGDSRLGFDLVRPGLALYGIATGKLAGRLRPVLSLTSEVIQVKMFPKGAGVGYRSTFVCPRDTRLAILAVGYDDGLPRALGNRGEVLIAGGRAPLVGAISMDLAAIDVTDRPGVRRGTRAVVIGERGGDRIGAEQIAAACGTIAWEVLCGIGARVPRVYRRGRRTLAIESRFGTNHG